MPKKLKIVPPSAVQVEDWQYLNALRRARDLADANINSFSEFLTAKYKLVEGDSISPTGQIIRKG